MADETTTKFKVDISELKKQFQEASRQVRIANSEFKAATAGMDNWATSADGVSAKTKQLSDVLSAQKTQLKSLEDQYALVSKEQGENSKGAQELLIKINNQKAAIGKTESELNKYKSRLEDIQQAASDAGDGTEDYRSASEKLQDTISEQEKDLEALKQEYANIVLEQGKTSKEARSTSKEIAKLSSELQQNKSKMAEAEGAADDLSDAVGDAGDSAEKAEGGFTVLKGALANLLADGIKGVASALKGLGQESQTANNQFQASTGASAEEMEQFSGAIQNLYKQNFGESLNDVAEAMAQVKQQTNETDPSKLEGLTKNAMILRDTFDMDVGESMRAVNQLMYQFGISGDEAFNLIAQGAQSGLNKNDNLLDSINEYGPKFQQMGLSADDMFNMLANGAENGVFDIDKLGDAVNEFSIRVKDGTADDAFKQLGLDVDKTKKKFGEGGDAAKQALQDTMDALANVEDPLEQNALGVQMFGSMWEDTGGKSILAMRETQGEISKTKDTMDEINDVKYDDIGSAFSEIGRTLKVELLQPIVDSILPGVNDFVGAVKEHLPEVKQAFSDGLDTLKEWSPVLAGIGAALATYFVVGKITAFVTAIRNGTVALKAMQMAQAALNVVMNLNPIGLIVAAIVGLVAAFVLLWNKSEAFRTFWTGVWEKVKEVTGNVVNGIVDFFTKTVPEAFDNFLSFMSGFIPAVIQFFQQLPGKIWSFLTTVISNVGTWVGNMVTKAKEVGSKFLTNVITFFKQLPGKIGSFLSNVISKVGTWVSNMASKAKDAGSKFVTNAINFIKQLPGKIGTFLSNVITKVGTWAGNMASKARDAGSKFVTNAINLIKQLPGKMATWLSNGVSKVVSWGSTMASKGLEAANKLVTTVVTAIKGIPGKVVSIGSDIVKGLWNGIGDMAGWIGEKIKGFGDGVLGALKNFFGIHSPSTVFRDVVGKNIVLGIAEGIGNTTGKAVTSMYTLSKKMLGAAKSANGNYKKVGQSVVEKFTSGINSYASTAIKSMTKLVNNQVSAMMKANSKNKSKYEKAGKSVITAYTTAIEKAAKNAITTLSTKLDAIAATAQEKYDKIADLQSSMNDKLSDYGELYTIDDEGNLTVNKLQDDLDALNKYSSNLSSLKGKISDDLMSEITQMDIDNALAYSDALLKMSSQELAAYNNMFMQKQELAKNISAQFYADKIQQIKTEYTDKVAAAFAEVKTQLESAGKDAIDGFMKGLTKGSGDYSKQVKKVANSIVKAMKKALKINSPSKVFEELGMYSGEGYELGFVDSLKQAKKNIVSALPTDAARNARNGNSGDLGAKSVTNNFYQYNTSPKALSRLEIYRQTRNQLNFAKGV